MTVKAPNALKHIFQSDVIIINNKCYLFIRETYLKTTIFGLM